ncbi:MAG: dTMP kinase [Endomicrobium sp.]|nr:dTMP kinase [Endomicrobium sp.]
MKKQKRFFITIEGGEGSGKTTQSFYLRDYFQQKGYKTLLTREPGGTVLAECIRNILLNPNLNLLPLSELFLYEAARVQHVKELILPALMSEKIVICDRFIDATVAYQGYGRKLDLKLINKLNFIAAYGIFPSLTIYLDIKSSRGLNKARMLNKKYYGKTGDRIESESMKFHVNVRNGYLKQAKKYPNRIKIVKIQKTPMQTQNLIRKIVDILF